MGCCLLCFYAAVDISSGKLRGVRCSGVKQKRLTTERVSLRRCEVVESGRSRCSVCGHFLARMNERVACLAAKGTSFEAMVVWLRECSSCEQKVFRLDIISKTRWELLLHSCCHWPISLKAGKPEASCLRRPRICRSEPTRVRTHRKLE